MKKALILTLLLLTAAMAAQAQTATVSTTTIIRIMINDSIAGWEYYFATDDKGHPPVLLADKENVITITTTKRNANGYIYAKNIAQTRQTNNFSFNLKGKPTFIMVAGNNGVLVTARSMKPNKYMLYRNGVPEGDRKPW